MATTSVDPTIAPVSTSAGWAYMIIGGMFIGAYHTVYNSLVTTNSSNGAYCSDVQTVAYPEAGISMVADSTAVAGSAGLGGWIANHNAGASNVTFRVYRNISSTANIAVDLIVVGKISSLA